MSKILSLFFVFFIFFVQILGVNASELNIISREKWGANENYRYLDSDYWQNIFEKHGKNSNIKLSDLEKDKIEKQKQKNKLALNFLNTSYSHLYKTNEIIYSEAGHKLVWPITKSKLKNSIVVHHTDTNSKDSIKTIRSIYKYHSIDLEWGDIGYNYLIGLDGEIFEGRVGGDSVVGAHDKWNNYFSVGIGIIGNYQDKPINSNQLNSLNNLINYLVEKYNMDLSKEVTHFKWCVGKEYCDTKPIVVIQDNPIIGHRDAGNTSCPGDKLYKQLLNLRQELITKYKNNIYYVLKQKFKKISEQNLINLLAIIEEKMDLIKNETKLKKLKKIKDIILFIEKNRHIFDKKFITKSFDDNNKIKVKLSYPYNDYISLSISGAYKPFLSKKDNEYILEFKEASEIGDFVLNFKYIENKLYLNNKELFSFKENDLFRIKSPINNILTINSWERKPLWDKSGVYNDNKFRGDIIFYKKNNSLIVVNDILLNYYLKGLGEVSNSTNPEKIKTIVVLARTYAKWYMTKAHKFDNEYYQASDDPNVFQKYLGYSLEKRSPIINNLVDETKDIIITYKGNLIKPWYFSSSNGYTKSFKNYCITAKGVPDCSNPDKFPFLSSAKDLGAKGNTQRGHGVGVPGTGIEYFATKGWDYNMIIKYFLKGVSIDKI